MKYIITLLFAVLFINESYSQKNIDSIFNLSLEYGKSNQYNLAIAEGKKALNADTSRFDIMIHLANVYGWQSEFDSAIFLLNKAYRLSPRYPDLYESWLNILLWKKDYAGLHKIAGVALQNGYPNQVNIASKKLIAYNSTGEYDTGLAYAKTVGKDILNLPEVKPIYNELYNRSKSHILSAYYAIDVFGNDQFNPQHLAFADYSFKTGKNTLVLRLNYAYRFDQGGIQTEADYYWLLKKGRYFYFNYGYGFSPELFPEHRLGIEYLFPAGKNAAASLGGRYLTYDSSGVMMGTFHFEKYIGNSWFSLRPYVIFSEQGNGFSMTANFRLYGSNPANFTGLELGYGNSPDDRYAGSFTGNVFRLDSYRIKAEKNFPLALGNEIKLTAGFAYEEYAENQFRNRYTFDILLKHRF